MGDEFLTGPIPSGWRAATLGEIVRRGGGHVQTGPFGSQLHASDYVAVGVPTIMPVNIGDNRLVEDGIARVSESDADRLGRHRVRTGDIIYSRRGDVERRALILPEQEGWLCGTGCLKIRLGNGGVDPCYASYFLGHPEIRTWIVRHAIGATMPNLNTSIMEAVPFLVPPLHEQRAIACILGSLDDKIELNRRMNQTLEEMARAIFKSWFIDFDPVRAKAAVRRQHPKWTDDQVSRAACPKLKPEIARLFPDSFADSELGEIPKGWEVKKFGDLLELAYGKALKAENRCHGTIPVYGSNGPVGWHDERLVTGPGIVVGRKGNPGIVTWVPTDFFPIDTTFYVVPKPSCQSLEFLYHALRNHDLASLGADSAVPGLNRNLVYMSNQLLPPPQLLQEFSRIAKALWCRVQSVNDECFTLAALRDALLPKLVSGELRVPDAERIAGRCA